MYDESDIAGPFLTSTSCCHPPSPTIPQNSSIMLFVSYTPYPLSRFFFLLLCLVVSARPAHAAAQCVSDGAFSAALGELPSGSCCQAHVCGLPCPEAAPEPAVGYVVAAFGAVVLSAVIGMLTVWCVRGRVANYFVAGRQLSLLVTSITLASQSIDANALLSNADLSYKFHFYDGAVLPLGLALSLFLNAAFFAAKLNAENRDVWTLPDVFAKRYGPVAEVATAAASVASFMFLLAGNLAGLAAILAFVTRGTLSLAQATWTATLVVWVYTAAGGLFSVAYTDVAQGVVGWTGALACAFWFIANTPHGGAAPPSRGFDAYIYPNNATCALYNGTRCAVRTDACCFNPDVTYPPPDNAAFPTGDQPVFPNQMSDPRALSPFPNALLWNWATIFILAFGNLAALDFQARCLASKTPRVATLGCIIAGCVTLLVGIPFSYLGAITRYYYGPDSPHATFNADSCSTLLGLPACAEWLPDADAFLRLLTVQAPGVLGAWCVIAIISASLSTSDGAILAMGTVFSRNILYPLCRLVPSSGGSPASSEKAKTVNDATEHTASSLQRRVNKHMISVVRFATVPFAMAGGAVAAYSTLAAKLLIVAFDVMLATCVVPLFGAFYHVAGRRPSAVAAVAAFTVGATTRIALEFALRKDGSFLLPYAYAEFKRYGAAASLKLPTFVDDVAANVWDPRTEACDQSSRFTDYSGVDSLTAFAASALTFAVVSVVEHWLGRPVFRFPGDQGYSKGDIDFDAHAHVHATDPTTPRVQAEVEEDIGGGDGNGKGKGGGDGNVWDAADAKEMDTDMETGVGGGVGKRHGGNYPTGDL